MTETKHLSDDVTLYTVSNGRVSFCAMNWGCTMTNLFVPNKSGGVTDILLGYDTLSGWQRGLGSHNAIVGRVANRIRGASFVLDGKSYALDKNDGENCLHGGTVRYEKLLWNAECFSGAEGEGVKFWRTSPDGEQGFPGKLDVQVSYALTEADELIFEYTAQASEATPVNLTNHAYFNLDGGGTVLNHRLQLDCEQYLESAEDSAPTGKICPVAGTPFDFRTEKLVGADIEAVPHEAGKPFGYDHCFVTGADESALVRVGALCSEKSGISMEIATNQRGVHVYTANFIGGTKGKGGVIHQAHDGICFETERFPNAINEPRFPSCVLRPGETYQHKTVFKLKTEK